MLQGFFHFGIEDIINKGYVAGAYMGVIVTDMDPEDAEIYDLPIGVYVKEVEAGGAAEKAGIRVKDIILSVDDQEVDSMASLTRVLRKYEPQQTAKLSVYRGGTKVELEITFGEKPNRVQQEVVPEATEPQQQQPQQQFPSYGGFGDWFGEFFPGFGN